MCIWVWKITASIGLAATLVGLLLMISSTSWKTEDGKPAQNRHYPDLKKYYSGLCLTITGVVLQIVAVIMS